MTRRLCSDMATSINGSSTADDPNFLGTFFSSINMASTGDAKNVSTDLSESEENTLKQAAHDLFGGDSLWKAVEPFRSRTHKSNSLRLYLKRSLKSINEAAVAISGQSKSVFAPTFASTTSTLIRKINLNYSCLNGKAALESVVTLLLQIIRLYYEFVRSQRSAQYLDFVRGRFLQFKKELELLKI